MKVVVGRHNAIGADARWTVYVVECSDGTFYTGITVDLPRRLLQHNNQKGAKYTRGRCPVELVYQRMGLMQSEARRAEYAMKKLAKKSKSKIDMMDALIDSICGRPL